MQRRMLVTTIIGYTLFYFLRKNLSLAMPGLGALGADGVGVGMWRWCFWAPAIIAAAVLCAAAHRQRTGEERGQRARPVGVGEEDIHGTCAEADGASE